MGACTSHPAGYDDQADRGADSQEGIVELEGSAKGPDELAEPQRGRDRVEAGGRGETIASARPPQGKRGSLVGPVPSKRHGDVSVAAALRARRDGGRSRHQEILPSGASFRLDAPAANEAVPKAPEERQLIGSALKGNALMNVYGESILRRLIDVAQPLEVAAGMELIRQGDEGDAFYVISHGKFAIAVNGKHVDTFGDGTPNKSFGELALLYNSPRAATVSAMTDGKLWAIDRDTFRTVVALSSHAQQMELERSLRRGILEDLDDEQISRIANAVTVVRFRKGDRIIRKGEKGEVFYFIKDGQVLCTNIGGGQANNRLQAGDYVGERALLTGEPRAADVWAESDCELAAIDKVDFENLLGSLRQVLERNMGMRLLLCVPILARLESRLQADLFSRIAIASFRPNQHIIKQGERVSRFHIIRDGEVAVMLEPEGDAAAGGGSGDVLKTLSRGQWFGERELRQHAAARVSVVAKTEVECFVVDRPSFLRLLAPQLAEMASDYQRRNSSGPSPQRAGRRGSTAASAAAAAAATSSDAAAQYRPAGSSTQAAPAIEWKRLGIPFNELQLGPTLGTGSFGRVRWVAHRPSNRVFALKALSKARIVQLKQQKNIMNEKRMLARMNHPFIIKLYDTYKHPEWLYMLLELVQGGELFSRLQNSELGRVPVSDARFYSACVLDALHHIHSHRAAYRDLKPENLLIDADGYIKLVDFGFAKVIETRSYTLCGTPEYLAPELVTGKGHNQSVDIWALGILLFEMVAGYSPFSHPSNDQLAICRNILHSRVRFPSHAKTVDFVAVVSALLEKRPSKRLGCMRGGVADVRRHRFFRRVDWDRLQRRRVPAPWRPQIQGAHDTSNFDKYDEVDRVEPFEDVHPEWWRDF